MTRKGRLAMKESEGPARTHWYIYSRFILSISLALPIVTAKEIGHLKALSKAHATTMLTML